MHFHHISFYLQIHFFILEATRIIVSISAMQDKVFSQFHLAELGKELLLYYSHYQAAAGISEVHGRTSIYLDSSHILRIIKPYQKSQFRSQIIYKDPQVTLADVRRVRRPFQKAPVKVD